MDDKQKILFHAAMSSDPPLITNDPVVNHAVDQMVLDSGIPYDVRLYNEEIEAWKKSGGLLLGFVSSN